jgi:hypothetical protein
MVTTEIIEEHENIPQIVTNPDNFQIFPTSISMSVIDKSL